MARDAIAFLDAMEFSQADVLGFSIGSFVARDIALIRPSVLRRLILASSAPQGAGGMHGWVADVIDAVGVPEVDLDVFNTRSPSGRHAGEQAGYRCESYRGSHQKLPASALLPAETQEEREPG
jgi:pimeloyl-ACP methyl ester carboxylesterase